MTQTKNLIIQIWVMTHRLGTTVLDNKQSAYTDTQSIQRNYCLFT